MSRLTAELTLSHINDWFRIGGPPASVPQSLSSSKLGGRGLDPTTGQAAIDYQNQFVPTYRRHARDAEWQTKYAEGYQKQWEQEELGLDDDVQDDLFAHGAMSELESVTEGMSMMSFPGKALMESEATQVYENYDFDHQYNKDLPITQYQEAVINTIESNQVTVIQGATGCGKTTQVPQFILDHYVKENRHCNIVVTQPRRIAAMSIAKRVCDERNWQLGSLVGYQVGMDKQLTDDTRLAFVTTGVLLQKLINTRTMNEYTHVILDEVHERDLDSDFALLVARKLLRTNSRCVKIILMSASIDTDLFTQYFAHPVLGCMEPAPVVTIEGKVYDVEEFYLGDLSKLGQVPRIEAENPQIETEMYTLAKKLLLHFDDIERIQQSAGEHAYVENRGTVLVFLPGLPEIHTMDELLNDIINKRKILVLPLHSSITAQEQARVFTKPLPGVRKVILATNIAESSITVPDIKYVIDFMLIKCLMCDLETSYQSLKLNWASRANAIQRKGRAGRVAAGRVYRLVTKHFWEMYIHDYGIAEMRRCPLEKLVLQVKLLDLGEPKAILGLALEPPNLDDIERTILLLKEVGAISTLRNGLQNPHDGDLTFPGKVLASLPVDIRFGKLIILGHVFGCLKECVIIGAALSLKSFFARPFGKDLDAFRHKKGWAEGSYSDCLATLNAYRKWEEAKMSGAFRRTGRGEVDWGKKNFIQTRRIQDVCKLVNELGDRLAKFNIHLPRGNPRNQTRKNPVHEILILKMILAGAFYPNYFLQLPSDEQDAHRQMSGKDPCTTVMVKGMPPNACHNSPAVAALFRPCGKGKTLHFEESKVFVEFERLHMMSSGDGQNVVLPAVYLAVKMRQLRMPLTLDIYEANDDYTSAVAEAQDNLVLERKLKTNRVGASFDESGPKSVPPPSPDTSWIKIYVTEVSDGNRLWAHDAEPATFEQLGKLMETINRTSMKHLKGYEVGQYCLAPFEDDTLMYYRARIEAVTENMLEVFFLDYGNVSLMPSRDLRQIHPDMLVLPFQAFECVLCEIKPFNRLLNQEQWMSRAKEKLTFLACNKVMLAKVFSVVGGVLRIELIACTETTEVNINDLLIEEHLAERTEEPLASKINHQQRVEVAAHYNMQQDYIEAPKTPDLKDPNKYKRRGKVNLHGPFSPLEVTFTGMTQVGSLRSVRVERDSVNSVTLDNEPQAPYQKMMVAAHISLNNSGSVLIVRDSTLMPDIKGLPPLACILFAPTIELRTDRAKKQMTGVLCGLGWDPIFKGPALPDHDIEIPFDVSITKEDISKVNGLRLAINLAIGSPDAITQWGPSAVNKIQNQARERLLDLILKRRESIIPQYYPRTRQWNQLSPDDILYYDASTRGENDHEDYPKLFEYHCGVMVSEELEEQEQQVLLHHKRNQNEEIHKLASRSSVQFDKPIVCSLCDAVFYSPRDILSHVRGAMHREKEQELVK